MKRKVALTLLLLINSLLLFAQPGLPGDGCDADDCEVVPLDNWVIILVAGALILTTVYLHNKQKKEAIA